jgi:hypothetical protein
MAESIRAFIAIKRGIGRAAYAERIEDKNECACH